MVHWFPYDVHLIVDELVIYLNTVVDLLLKQSLAFKVFDFGKIVSMKTCTKVLYI